MSRVVITGPGGGTPNRLEINDLIKNEKQFSLYIQALQAMSSKDQSILTSFFQVGGIHGLPYVEWDGSDGEKPFDPQTQWGGYCTHGSVLFPTWHRPYMMLYEQTLWKLAQDIAAKYTVDPAGWKQAALSLRQPYWDWAKKAVPPDQVISLKQVTITNFAGQKVSVDNPLFHYRFHPIDPSFPSPYSQWETTFRRPTTTGPKPTDNVAALRRILTAMQSDITTDTYNMLTRVNTWPAFSNHTVGDGGSTSNSLEAIHDNIHVYVGGNGHMGDPAVAGFDPIFFLHHCNVDRMLSLWSAMNPSVWVSKGDSQDGSFTLPPEAPVDEKTGLTPFWNAETTIWASAGTRDTSVLGYTYPEFNGLDMGNPTAVKSAITAKINALYGGAIFGTFANLAPTVTAFASAAPAAAGAGAEQAQAFAAVAPAAPAAALSRKLPPVAGKAGEPQPVIQVNPGPFPEGSFWDWTARIHFKKYELGTSFSVWLFLGSVPENVDDWLTSPNLVGSHHAFVNSAAGRCANCRGQADITEEGFVHLSRGIATHSGLGSLEPEVVAPYLKKELHWRVQKTDGTAAHLESLEVTIFATPLTFPPGAEIPVPGERRRHNTITYGRRGGSRHE